ncbi:hypothetical protein FACS1894152_5150 [Bacilli bacterium]|nr:hypothetical protein FACS1894152_5150 [Bacilli bacterium]
MIFDTNYTWKKLSDIALLFADSAITVYDTNNYTITDLTNSMKQIRASQLVNTKLKLKCIILNNFSRDNNSHLATLLNIDKILYKQQSVITLPFVNELVEVSDKSLSYTNSVQ